MPDSTRERGSAAERFVAKRLTGDGYRILERNWSTRDGEIDIIAMDGDVLVFVEVRSRRGDSFGTAEESVTPGKFQRIVKTGLSFIETQAEMAELYWRVDLVAVTLDQRGAVSRYNHYENLTLD